MVPCCYNYAMSRKCYISAWKRFSGNALYGDCLVEKPQKCQQQTLIILFVPLWKSIFIPLVSHISALKKQKNNPNMKWYKMIYERGSLERRWYVQEAFSQDDHVLNRLPLLKYSWAEIYSLIFHYLLPLLCILQEFSTSAAHSHFHLPPCRSAEDAFSAAHFFVTLSSLGAVFFFFFLTVTDPDGEGFWGSFF